MSNWSPQQDAALVAVNNWLKNPDKQVFRLFGYAGTGKTTLARHLAEGIDGEVAFGAFTGKAALVMRTKGCHGASTIHSMIYRISRRKDGSIRFILDQGAAIRDAKLVIIDECSMVDEELGNDLLSFEKPVLVLGDPAQLPPVRGQGFFTEAKPDILLTEVHRQARDNPIINLAMRVREGKSLEIGTYGNSKIISVKDIDQSDVLGADQVLVGKNRTRHLYNARIRTLLKKSPDKPVKGDRLVCLKNNHFKGLLNGGIWQVERANKSKPDLFSLNVTSLDYQGEPIKIKVRPQFFDGTESELEREDLKGTDQFTYGYALTVHKSQGSQWDDVIIFDEADCFREDANRWMYTAITRAAERVTVVQ